jgi:hypothetical protein
MIIFVKLKIRVLGLKFTTCFGDALGGKVLIPF